MGKRSSTVLAFVLAASIGAAALAVWMFGADSFGRAASGDDDPAPALVERPAEDVDSPELAATPADAPASPDSRATAAPLTREELTDSLWINGSVRLPDGLPAGEQVVVLATSQGSKDRR